MMFSEVFNNNSYIDLKDSVSSSVMYTVDRKPIADQLEERSSKDQGISLKQIGPTQMDAQQKMQAVPGTPLEGRDLEQLMPDLSASLGSSEIATAFNYVNSVIGSGIIGTSYALKEAGFGVGILLLIFVAFITDFSLRILVTAGNMSGTSSYQGLMEASFGKGGYIILSVIQFIYPFVAMVSYNVIVGDTITKLIIRFSGPSVTLSNSVLASREFVIVVSTLLVTLPLSLYRDVDKLAKTSLASLIFVVIILTTIFIRAFTLWDQVPTTLDAWDFSHAGIPKAIGILAFAFMCHHNTFLLYGNMRDTSEKTWAKVTHWSLAGSFVAMVIVAVAGYVTFTGNTQGDLLENYCWGDDLMNVSRLFFAFTILLTFPIECFVCREVITNAVTSLEDKTTSISWRHIGVTVGIIFLVCISSLTTDCLGIVLELNGILAAVPLAFIMPPLCYVRVQGRPYLRWSNVSSFLVAAFGAITSIAGIAVLFRDGTPDCSHGDDPPYCNSTELKLRG